MAGTYEDARLLVELAQWGAAVGLGPASSAIWADDFDPDTVDARDSPVATILVFYETVGTLVKNGLLNRALVDDWLWSAGTWSRVGPAAQRAREAAGEPRLYENFEALAGG